MELKPELLGKRGFYCGTFPTYISGNCNGCVEEHMEGDCFTWDCVIEKRFRCMQSMWEVSMWYNSYETTYYSFRFRVVKVEKTI